MSPDHFLLTVLRAQFGLSASFHFLFVPLSIGLLLCMNVLQTAYVFRQDKALERAARFWGYFFFLMWLTGILTGYPLRWQLADLWAHYLDAATPILKAIFAIEGAIAPFMIACSLIVVFLRTWLPAIVTMVLGWILLGLLCMQAWTILSVNAWMQAPGHLAFAAGSWQLSSVDEVLLSPTAIHKCLHTLTAAMLSGAFFLFAIAGYYLRTGKHKEVAQVSVSAATWVGMLAVIGVLGSGHTSVLGVCETQPMKFAAFEGHWHAKQGDDALVVLAWPDEASGMNQYEIAIPRLMGWLGAGDTAQPPLGINDLLVETESKLMAWQNISSALPSNQTRWLEPALPGMDINLDVKANAALAPWLRLRHAVAQQQGDQWLKLSAREQAKAVAIASRPPVFPLFFVFRLMVLCGVICLVLCVVAFVKRKALATGQANRLLQLLGWAAPLPSIAIISGWFVAEVGRQPWAIYEHMPTMQASSLPAFESEAGQFGLMLMGAVLITVVFWHVARYLIRKGPSAG
jgi:cytochrome d ubiquinol oxidase subunit I